MSAYGYTFAFDWSRNGTYGGTAEDVTGYIDGDDDLVLTVGRDTSQAGADLPAGTLDFQLVDQDRAFAPENTSSPIAGKVQPGVPAVLQLTVAGATATLFAGVLDDFQSDSTEKTFAGTIRDAWGGPGDEQLSTTVYQGYRTGDLIGVVLDLIGWTGGRDIDPGATFVQYWWEEGNDAATAVQKIVDSEGPPAIAYVDGGIFVFRDRHHRITRSASTTSQGTYTHIVPAGSGPPGDFKMLTGTFTYNHGLRSIVNSAAFDVDQRAPQPEDAIWSTDTPITLAAGASTIINISGADPVIYAQTPVQDTDYTLVSGSVTMALSRTSGVSLALTVTAVTTAIISRLQVRATSLRVARSVKVTREDAGSVALRGRRSWPRSVPWANAYDADAIASRIVATYAVARPVLTFTVDGQLSTQYLQQFQQRRVSDRITVRNDVIGVNSDFIVEKIVRTIKKLGLVGHQLQITCEAPEPVQPATTLKFDVAGQGFNQGAFGVDGIDNAATMFRFDTSGQSFDQGRFAT